MEEEQGQQDRRYSGREHLLDGWRDREEQAGGQKESMEKGGIWVKEEML